ncbi:hypothetical protein C2G38_2267758 [Gigaspora rosea]|uniref:Proliferating cell nuclear antigen PCNA C-terminal domain-containing protein n=1 Tax=Gigaspora rosea TaxID=44941 RepID=A0A397W290_9GLOM|nr:hypothetical protein C2G38_2267758 [Gigaspora rosea]
MQRPSVQSRFHNSSLPERVCSLCGRDYYHRCCASCKRTADEYRCRYHCALAYPSTYSVNGKVATWDKCAFHANSDDEMTMERHLKVCMGTISENLTIMFLKTGLHQSKAYATVTVPELIELDGHRCENCRRIHDPNEQCAKKKQPTCYNCNRILARVNVNDGLTLEVDECKLDILSVHFESMNSSRKSTYELKLLDINQEQLQIFEVEYPVIIRMATNDFRVMCQDLTVTGDQYLSDFSKAYVLSEHDRIYLKEDMPILLEYEIRSSYMRHYLAPKVKE